MADTIQMRCSDCAFLNPDESVYCGMCGSKLAIGQSLTKTQTKKENYEKHVTGGTLGTVFNYGNLIFARQTPAHIGGTILLLIALLLTWVFDVAVRSIGTGTSVFIFVVDLFIVAFLWGTMSRAFLDGVRERKVTLGRSIGAGIRNILPVAFICFVFAAGVAITAGLYWLWSGPVESLRHIDLPLSSGYIDFMLGVWATVAIILLMLPAAIWLPLLTQLAIFRVIDRRSQPWYAPIWAINQVVHYHWELFWLVLRQIFVHIFGLVVCYIGILATLPIAGMQNAAIYDWLRLNGDEPEKY